jgi:hypothetical protein
MTDSKDPEKVLLERVAKRMLAMPPKPRDESKIGKRRPVAKKSPASRA